MPLQNAFSSTRKRKRQIDELTLPLPSRKRIKSYFGTMYSQLNEMSTIKTKLSDMINIVSRAYLKTQKSCIIQTKAKWEQRVRKKEKTKQAYHNEQQFCEKL